MNPLMMRIKMGLEDTKLEEHIRHLESCDNGSNGSAGISDKERQILEAAKARLEEITRP